MAVIISNNMVIGEQSGTMTGGNAPVLAYNNILNVSNVTASSALPSNPITNVANPVTAYTWESAIADYAGAVSYPDTTNLMPSPFDPSGWNGASDTDGIMTLITTENPSGEPIVGNLEFTGNGNGVLAPCVSSFSGDGASGNYYSAVLIKLVAGDNHGLQARLRSASSTIEDIGLNLSTGNWTASNGGSVKVTAISEGFSLVEFRHPYDGLSGDVKAELYWRKYNADGSVATTPDVGSTSQMQAAFFGKANDWPALVDEPGVKINVNTAGQSVDYIGIARHNLNQIGLTVTVRYNGITVVNAVPISDVQALLFLQNEAVPDDVEIIIKGATVAPQIGVIYIGKSLRLERNIYVGHTPIPYGRNRKTVNGVSENGQYLGEIVVRSNNATSVNLQNLTPTWYRSFLDPFFKLSPRIPCFWAWRPETYPDEVGYAWVEGEPNMSNQRANGMVQVSWNFKGNA